MRPEKEIESHYGKASKAASVFVEQQAREILRKHSELHEFVMAMGGYFFTRKIGTRGSRHMTLVPGESPIILRQPFLH
jgi:hypothetical protein